MTISHIGCICLTFFHCAFSNVFKYLTHSTPIRDHSNDSDYDSDDEDDDDGYYDKIGCEQREKVSSLRLQEVVPCCLSDI